MAESPLLSVIVPVYNVDIYLKECLDSIVTQTYKKLEIWLIDDGSTDESGKICEEYAKKDNRINVIHQKNGGISCARNVGIKHCTGQFVTFVDSDDVIHPRMYEFMIGCIEECQAEVACCNTTPFENQFEKQEYEKYVIKVVENNQTLVSHFTDDFVAPMNRVWNKVYASNLIKTCKFVEGSTIEDAIFSAEVLSKVRKIVWLDNLLYGYRQRSGSIMHHRTDKLYYDMWQANVYQYEILKEYNKNQKEYLFSKLSRIKAQALQDNKIEVYYNLTKEYKQFIRKLGISDLSLKMKIIIFLSRYSILFERKRKLDEF